MILFPLRKKLDALLLCASVGTYERLALSLIRRGRTWREPQNRELIEKLHARHIGRAKP